MEAKTTAKFNMVDDVIVHLNANPTILTAITNLQTKTTKLIADRATTRSTAEQLGIHYTNITANKKQAKTLLADKAAKIYTAIIIYQKDTNLNILTFDTKASKSYLSQAKDLDTITTSTTIQTTALANAASLIGYGVQNTDITELQNLINNFQLLMQELHDAMDVQKVLKDNLKQQIKTLDNSLLQVDQIVTINQEQYPQFYNLYWQKRKIQDPTSTINGMLRGKVLDSAFQQPIHGAKITLLEKNITKQSNENGGFQFSKLETASYTFKIQHPLYITKQVGPVFVPHKKLVKLNINISKGLVAQMFQAMQTLSLLGSAIQSKTNTPYVPNIPFHFINDSNIANIKVWGSITPANEAVTKYITLLPGQEIIITSSDLGEENWTNLNFKNLDPLNTATINFQKGTLPTDQILQLLY